MCVSHKRPWRSDTVVTTAGGMDEGGVGDGLDVVVFRRVSFKRMLSELTTYRSCTSNGDAD